MIPALREEKMREIVNQDFIKRSIISNPREESVTILTSTYYDQFCEIYKVVRIAPKKLSRYNDSIIAQLRSTGGYRRVGTKRNSSQHVAPKTQTCKIKSYSSKAYLVRCG